MLSGDVGIFIYLTCQFFFFTPWFSPVKEGIMERIVRLSAAVDKEVELGYHLCYGDIQHRHFV